MARQTEETCGAPKAKVDLKINQRSRISVVCRHSGETDARFLKCSLWNRVFTAWRGNIADLEL